MWFIDTYNEIMTYFPFEEFNMQNWIKYTKLISPHLYGKIVKDVSGYNFDNDILPVVTAALRNKDKIQMTHDSFQKVISGMESNFITSFGKTLEVDVILYLGLCSGAGWATLLDNKQVVLLGIEKIIELEWYDKNTMYALISHEIGHIWHMNAGGRFHCQKTQKEKAVFQLYSEGVAMWCEQKLCRNDDFYHGHKKDWLIWCKGNIMGIKQEYFRRVQNDISVQDFFGDWCNYKGHSDVGYYLGCQFVRFLLSKYDLYQMASLNNDILFDEFILFSKNPSL